jgi:hypothetical protein
VHERFDFERARRLDFSAALNGLWVYVREGVAASKEASPTGLSVDSSGRSDLRVELERALRRALGKGEAAGARQVEIPRQSQDSAEMPPRTAVPRVLCRGGLWSPRALTARFTERCYLTGGQSRRLSGGRETAESVGNGESDDDCRFGQRFAGALFAGVKPRRELQPASQTTATWLILPVVICLSQRLSHACPSTSLIKVKPRMAH